jgi:DNA polymerase-3 subunit epsilon
MTPRQRSFDDLGCPLSEVTFCVIDLETTGGHRHDDRITEIGAVKVRGGECLGTFQTLVNPGRAIPPQITVLTGLTDAVVRSAPNVGAVLPSLLEFVGDAVIVGHNISFDLAFLANALACTGRDPLTNIALDTVSLARRLVRDEVPNCKLDTLASRFRLDHRPSHRALDDALATTDLLHLLIERAAALGVYGLDDLLAVAKLAGHPQSAKLKMTVDLPRTPGVYMFCGHRGQVLYVGKATNLRQRVRSYFSTDDRRKIGPLLRETQSVRHLDLPDPLAAEVIERRLIAQLLPHYNRSGTRVDRYCYVRLDTDTAWPRLSITKNATAKGLHLGPLPSRASAQQVIEAIQSVVPLRRCSTRLGGRHVPPTDQGMCAAAQLGVSSCPCAGIVDRAGYDSAVDQTAAVLRGSIEAVADPLTEKMRSLASQQRYEEAANVRDRLSALAEATKRQRLTNAMRACGRAELTNGTSWWVIDQGLLIDAGRNGVAGRVLPVPPPDPAAADSPLPRELVDEVLVLARFCNRNSGELTVTSSGSWSFPVT